ncbi:MAG TPA: GxxExxY protein [Fibrella sp.]
MQYTDITDLVIGASYTVHNTLGPGFLEKVYENALVVELQAHGLNVSAQISVPVHYRDVLVGDFVADLLVEDCVLIELKAVEVIHPKHEAQLVNYLTATGFDIGLLINFGNSVTIKRKYRVYKPR